MRTSGLAEIEHAPESRAGQECCHCSRSCGCGTAPILLLALGNPLMADDGAGQEILARIASQAPEWGAQVEFVDGGTQGLSLLGSFEERKAVVFLDAIRLGDKAGAVHILRGDELLKMGGRATTAHEGSAPDILRALELLGEAPGEIALVGIEPEKIRTEIGLSEAVKDSIGLAASFSRMTVNRLLAGSAGLLSAHQ